MIEARTWRRAALRSALPALVAGALFGCVDVGLGPGAAFLALCAFPVTLLDAALARRRVAPVATALAGSAVFVVAVLQGIYTRGLIEGRTFESALRALHDLLAALDPRDPTHTKSLTFAIAMTAAAGLAQELALFAARRPPAKRAVAFVHVLGTLAAAALAGAGASFLEPDFVNGPFAFGSFSVAATFIAAGVLVAAYLTADQLEQGLWPPARLDGGSRPGPSSRPLP